MYARQDGLSVDYAHIFTCATKYVYAIRYKYTKLIFHINLYKPQFHIYHSCIKILKFLTCILFTMYVCKQSREYVVDEDYINERLKSSV